MKIKLKEAVNSVGAISSLLKTSLPVKVSYKLLKLADKIDPELKIYNDQKNKLVTELGEEVDGVSTLKLESPNMPKFQEEIAKLEDIEIDIMLSPDKDFEKIKIDDLGDIKIEPQDLFVLKWLFE